MTLFAENNSFVEDLSEAQYALGFGSCNGGGMPMTARFFNGLLQRFSRSLIPSRSIIIWSGTPETVPTGFVVCDGNNQTPDLRDKFIMSAGINYQTGTNGGVEINLSGAPSTTVEVGAGVGTTVASLDHTHNVTTLPPFFTLVYIMKT